MVFSLLRIQQWIKNFLIFSNGIFLHNYNILFSLDLIYAFLSFSLIASSGYIINDIVDLDNDKKHPQKKNRPIQSGKISIKNAIIIFIFLFLISNLFATIVSIKFLITINVYLAISLIYSFYLKKFFFIDIIFISTMLFIRIFSGEFVYNVETSIYLLSISFAVFLTLLSLKRLSELKASNLVYYKSKNYNQKNINLIFYFFFLISLVILVFYFIFGDGEKFYENNIVFFIIFSFSFWVLYLKKKADDGQIIIDPFLFCLKDKVSILFAIFTLILIIFFGK